LDKPTAIFAQYYLQSFIFFTVHLVAYDWSFFTIMFGLFSPVP
jgi:hypothetical protein